MKKLPLFLAIFILFLTTSCAISKDPAYDSLVSRLKNRGIVALSQDNPYIASNLLIAKEIESSDELRGFTNLKGVPSLIEVDKQYFKNLKYKFFYPNEQNFYNLELLNNTWVISGPETINATQARQIYYLTGGNISTPKVLINSNSNTVNQNNDDIFIFNSNTNNQALPNNNTYQGASTNNIQNSAPNTNSKNAPLNNAVKNNNTGYKGALQNQDTQKATISKAQAPTKAPQGNYSDVSKLDNIIKNTSTYTAELNYQGDLVHYVTYKGEDLSLLSRWYTKDPSNADKISRINSKKPTDALQVGDKIIIPSYLLKNKNKLTQKALYDMISTFGGPTNTMQNPTNNAPSAPQNANPYPNINNSEIEFF